MVVMVALLRGVNVGGSGILPMARLREVATSVGLADVRSYIQSGNLVFSTSRRSTDAVAAELRSAIAAATALDPEVVVRTRAELARVVADSPFLRRGDDPSHLHVLFLSTEAAPVLDGMELTGHRPEEAAAVGRDLHLLLPGGVGRSRLATDLARRTGPTGTMRSWRTVTKLLELADGT